MKKFLLLLLAGVFIFVSCGCRKQNIKYNNQNDGMVVASVAFSDEPSVRGKVCEDNHLKTIYFDFDKSDLTNNIRDTLKENAAYLTSNSGLKIELEGHTDNRGTTEYNLALGQRRALKVKEYYIQLGVAANRIATISYGKEKPVDLNDNEVAWAKNRRAETKVLER
ncbi:MAG: peptidoglycan-associated lipoprotein Pal [Endomicrobium sp.]|jgi:peptidoglycan-associated lipoprotein|nr:peptidoglycan-associated lipoprotein Pal [Endomicrobium sp.]